MRIKKIVEKYLHRSKEVRREMIGYDIWMHSVIVKELLAPGQFDWETSRKVLADVQAFAAGQKLKNDGTDEEKADVAQVIAMLEERMFKHNMWRCTVATRKLCSDDGFNRDEYFTTWAEVIGIAESKWLKEYGTAKQKQDVYKLIDRLEGLRTASCG